MLCSLPYSIHCAHTFSSSLQTQCTTTLHCQQICRTLCKLWLAPKHICAERLDALCLLNPDRKVKQLFPLNLVHKAKEEDYLSLFCSEAYTTLLRRPLARLVLTHGAHYYDVHDHLSQQCPSPPLPHFNKEQSFKFPLLPIPKSTRE